MLNQALQSPALTAFLGKFRAEGDAGRAAASQRFFKTGPGQYGEGDQFLGIPVPVIRAHLVRTAALNEEDLSALIKSPWHEERLLALLCLVRRFQASKKDEGAQKRIVDFYLSHTRWVNNWDLVDSSAPHILGKWLLGRDRDILHELAASASLWEQRIAVLATQTFIRHGEFADALRLCESLLDHPHDLMHKACGWMLREIGAKEPAALRTFLTKHATTMPRTMLRYAIEKLTPEEKQQWMSTKKAISPTATR